MLTDFGMLKPSADAYRGVLQRDKQNIAAYEGLGAAEFQLGDYAAAEQAYRHVLTIDASNKEAARKTQICSTLLAWDPSLPSLKSDERFRRSQIVLRKVFEAQTHCVAPSGGRRATGTDAEAARAALTRRRSGSFTDAANSNVALAERLWAQRLTSCQAAPASDDPLELLMAKLGKR
jgi:tetratricopeptide (TPR) repeat protein